MQDCQRYSSAAIPKPLLRAASRSSRFSCFSPSSLPHLPDISNQFVRLHSGGTGSTERPEEPLEVWIRTMSEAAAAGAR
uniref:Uncharacterized protein n=1 Tax=Knipowitschia caucasica TaxID=637954 RepID=A0AAV2M6Y0_KNICA